MSEMTKVLGTVAMEPKGNYDADTYYEKLNTVLYNDSTYMAKEPVQGETPSVSSKWQLIGGGVRREDIVDNLDSNDATKMLSAKQGKVLNEGKVQVFDTVALMKAANLKNGMTVQTLGYYSANDGGGATYKITNTASVTEYQETVGSLYATLLIDDNINIKQLGAYGDDTHDDSSVFKNAITLARTINKYIYMPKGTYLLEPNVFQNIESSSIYINLTIKGDGKFQSTLKLNNTTTGQWLYDSTNNQKYSRINFYELGFTGNDITANGFYCYSTGNEKQLRFYNCLFKLNDVLYCAGTGNADLHRFYDCSMEIYGNFLTLDNAQSLDTELFGTSGVLYGTLVKVKAGGCCNIYGGDFDSFVYNSNIKYVFDLSEATQSIGNLGVFCNGTRFELHNGHKFINATSGNRTLLEFTNCNMGTADSISDPYSTIYKNSSVIFNSCTINPALKFYVYTTGSWLSDSSYGALLKFNNCSTSTQFWKLVTTDGNFSRVIADGCMNIATYGTYEANDFDWNANQRNISALPTKTKICYIKKNGEGFPSVGGSMNYNLPPKAYIKRIKVYRPATATGSGTYQLHIGSRDESVTYAESTVDASVNDELNIEEEDIGVVEDGQIKLWGTGTTTAFVGGGYAYIEYI